MPVSLVRRFVRRFRSPKTEALFYPDYYMKDLKDLKDPNTSKRVYVSPRLSVELQHPAVFRDLDMVVF